MGWITSCSCGPVADPQEALGAEISAIVIGPLLAVLYQARRDDKSRAIDRRRVEENRAIDRQREEEHRTIDREREERVRATERKTSILRALLVARTVPADMATTYALNLVPIEFEGVDAVLQAWEEFSSAAGKGAIQEQHVHAPLKTIMLDLGFKERAASQIVRTPYLAKALATQQKLTQEALQSLPRIANATGINARAMIALVEQTRPRGPSPSPPLADDHG